ncbi:hypothetical protein [Micromonospora sp. WMMD1082]|uniref:hypothetical protein n=1 Tax=Micromonospora sp. WMMD1082 TaxID=3016104 RepID=UPI0024164C80|nr:hypothetical protein [Micromonospora sp. WMMD1082]MDG4795398.1 hypothetical protein [Micromonospora sp. WMMD1082]
MRKTPKVFVLSAVVLFLSLLWQPGIAAQAAPSHDIASASTQEALLANWVPWDGNHITTQQKCLNRRSYIATTYGISYSALRCDQRNDGLPPCQTYWILMVDLDRTLRATGSSPARTVTDLAPVKTTAEAACA